MLFCVFVKLYLLYYLTCAANKHTSLHKKRASYFDTVIGNAVAYGRYVHDRLYYATVCNHTKLFGNIKRQIFFNEYRLAVLYSTDITQQFTAHFKLAVFARSADYFRYEAFCIGNAVGNAVFTLYKLFYI